MTTAQRLTASGITTRPLSSDFGVAVQGVDLNTALQPDTAKALKALFLKHRLLLFRAPGLCDEAQVRLARLFGAPSLRERNKEKRASEHNQFVSNHRPDGIFGKGELDFHMDQLFLKDPLKAIILYAIEVPDEGGDTKFADARAAYEALSAEQKERIDTLHCRHARAYDAKISADWNVAEAAADIPNWVHPMARRDPETGRRALWVNKLTTVGVEGLSSDESHALFEKVRHHLYDPALTYHHRWTPGDLILWDNLALQHARTPFDPAARRTLRRTAIL